MLSMYRRRLAGRCRRTKQVQRTTESANPSRALMFELNNHSVLKNVFVGHQIFHRAHWAARHSRSLQSFQPLVT